MTLPDSEKLFTIMALKDGDFPRVTSWESPFFFVPSFLKERKHGKSSIENTLFRGGGMDQEKENQNDTVLEKEKTEATDQFSDKASFVHSEEEDSSIPGSYADERNYLGLDDDSDDMVVIEVYNVRELQEAMARLSNQIEVRGALAPQLKEAYTSVAEKNVTELNELAATLFLPFTGGISLREVRAAIREKLEKMFEKDQQKNLSDIGVALVFAVYKGYAADFQEDGSMKLSLRTVNPQLF